MDKKEDYRTVCCIQLEGIREKAEMIAAIQQADQECGNCKC